MISMGLNYSKRRKTQFNNSNFIIIEDESSSKTHIDALKKSPPPSQGCSDQEIESKKYLDSNFSFRSSLYKMVSQIQRGKTNSLPRKASGYLTTTNSKISNYSEKSTSTCQLPKEFSLKDFRVLDKQSAKRTHLELLNKHEGYNIYSFTPTGSTISENISCKRPIYNCQFCTAVYDKDAIIKNPSSNQSELPHRKFEQNPSTVIKQVSSPKVAGNNGTVIPASSSTIEKSQSFVKRFFDKVSPRTMFFRRQTSENFHQNYSNTTESCIKNAMVRQESQDSLENQTDSSHGSDTSLHYESFSDPSMIMTLSTTETLSNKPFPKQLLQANNMLQHDKKDIVEQGNEECYGKNSLEAEFIMASEKRSSLLDILKAQLSAYSFNKQSIYSNKETQTQDIQQGVRKINDPDVKIVKRLETKYKKCFKTLDEILEMPPKQQILLITKGEGEELSNTSIAPSCAVFNYEEFLKSFKSGI